MALEIGPFLFGAYDRLPSRASGSRVDCHRQAQVALLAEALDRSQHN